MINPDLIREVPEGTRIIGTLAIKNAGDGCLLSKYANNNGNVAFTEACKLKPDTSDDFAFTGQYDSVWLQEGGSQTRRILEIRRDGERFLLQWTWNNAAEYVGVGMLYDGILVGAYWMLPNRLDLTTANG